MSLARRVTASNATGWIIPIALVAAWEAASRLGEIPANVLPAPSGVIAAALRLARSGELAQNIWVSALRALSGFVVGGGIGLALGLANGLSALSEKLTDTTLQMVRNVPHLALIPLVILWFGIEEEAKLFLVALGVFFPIYINTLHGIRGVDPQLVEMGRVYGMSQTTLFRRVILPGALPSIFVGLRYALGIMWLTLIVAETISASSGIGYMAMQAREFLLVDVVVLSIVIYALLGKLADTIARLLERLSLQWHPAFQTRETVMTAAALLRQATDVDEGRVQTRRRPDTGLPITIRGLAKSFGPKTVLQGLDLHIPAGQFVAIVGKSGCGKSTLLRLIAGLDEPSEGGIELGGEKQARRVTRLMFQEPRLLPWARVLGNVEVGLGRDNPKPIRRQQALDALDEVGLGDRGGDWPSVLSGGQKQRVALARALVSRPRLLALDEPLGALDALTRIEMQGLVERVWSQQRFTAILVTHDVGEALALADRVLVIDAGRIALDLPVDLPRPRRRGDPDLARLEGRIIDHLFNDQGQGI